MSQISWPKDGSPAHFSDIAEHVLSAIKELYTLTPKLFKKSIPFQIPKTFDEDAKSKISRADIEHAEEQGREPIHIFISGAVRLGAHQQHCSELLTRKTNSMTIDCVLLLLKRGDTDSIKQATELLSKMKF